MNIKIVTDSNSGWERERFGYNIKKAVLFTVEGK